MTVPATELGTGSRTTSFGVTTTPVQDARVAPGVQGRNLRDAVRRLAVHLKQHPALTADKVEITRLAAVPPPRQQAGTHFPWVGFTMVLHCSRVQDVMDWCHSTSAAFSLSVQVIGGGAELRLVTEINGGCYVVTAEAGWLADALHLEPCEKRPVQPALLTAALEAHARRSSAAVAVSGS